jgi:hypothetical protein
MTKHLLVTLIYCFFLSGISTFAQFIVKDVIAVSPQASIFDPEYNTQLNIVCWKSDDNDLWVSGLNPVTHLYEPSDGKGTFVTASLAPNGSESWNGPEWMLSSQGTQIVYIKALWGIRYPGIATKVFGGWQCNTLLQYPHVEYAMATADYTDSVASILFETADFDGITWLHNTDLWTHYHYPDVTLGFFARDNHQICCATDKIRNPGFIETTCSLPYFTSISNDTIGAPFMWYDPLTNNRLFMYRTNGFKTLKIFEEIAPDFWVLYNQFNSPLPEPFIYITSPEPFTCGGRSYISFMAAQSGSGKDGLPAQIWVAGANPEDSLMWRVSDSTLAIRTDPEPVVFNDSAFVYYTHVLEDNPSHLIYSVRKCDTGLTNLLISEEKQNDQNAEILIFPNPGNGRFTLQTNNVFSSVTTIDIFSMNGQQVVSQEILPGSTNLNLDYLPGGKYLLRVRDHKKTALKEFTIIK